MSHFEVYKSFISSFGFYKFLPEGDENSINAFDKEAEKEFFLL